MGTGQPTCPHCGAAIEQNSLECPYCHAALQTEICPKCFGLMFTGSKFCPHCGAVAQNLAPEGTKLQCPRCKVPLAAVTAGDTPLDECQRCGGLWISVAAFDHICSDTAAQTAATGLNLPPSVPQDTHVHYMGCPKCSNLMNRTNYGHASGIIINVCKPHGIWLDRDEMRQIVEFLRAGGMQKIHAAEEDRFRDERTELHEEERTGAAFADYNPLDLSGTVTPLSSWSGSGGLIVDLINSLIGHIRR
jgi:Zn-finger nucleic acid-binding protein